MHGSLHAPHSSIPPSTSGGLGQAARILPHLRGGTHSGSPPISILGDGAPPSRQTCRWPANPFASGGCTRGEMGGPPYWQLYAAHTAIASRGLIGRSAGTCPWKHSGIFLHWNISKVPESFNDFGIFRFRNAWKIPECLAISAIFGNSGPLHHVETTRELTQSTIQKRS